MHWLTVFSLGLFRPNVDGQIETVANQGEELGELFASAFAEGLHTGASRVFARKRQELLGVDTLEEEDSPLDVPIIAKEEPQRVDYSDWTRPKLMNEYRQRKGKPAKRTSTSKQLVKALSD